MVEKIEKSGQKKIKTGSVRNKIALESERLSFSLRENRGKGPRKSLRTFLSEETERAGDHFTEHFIQRLGSVKEVRLWVVEWVLLVLLVFFLAMAQIVWYLQAHQNQAYTSGGSYFEGSIGAVNSLNPLYANTESERILSRLMFAYLASPDESGHEKGDLARAISMDEAGKSWTVQLHDKMRWSDGEPITADDVVFTVGLIRNTNAKTAIAIDFRGTEVEKIDDLTVKFVLPSAYLDFTESLEFPVLPAHKFKGVDPTLVYENDFSKHPVVSGVFELNVIREGEKPVDSFVQQVYLNRNEDYHGRLSKLDSFILSVYEKPEDVATALKSGDILGTASLSEAKAKEYGVETNRRTSVLNGGVFAFINTDSMQSVKVRQAIQLGVDMEAVRQGFDGSRVLDYPILPSQIDGLNYPELKTYDQDAAKELLVAAGYHYDKNGRLETEEGKAVEITLAARSDGEVGMVANRFAAQLQSLGFDVHLEQSGENESAKDFFTSVVYTRNYDILLYEVDMGVSADPFAYYSSTQKEALNLSNYSNRLVDDALLSARTTTSEELRRMKYDKFLKYFIEDVPAIGIYRSALDYYYIDASKIYSENIQMTDRLDRFVDVNDWAVNKKTVEMTP